MVCSSVEQFHVHTADVEHCCFVVYACAYKQQLGTAYLICIISSLSFGCRRNYGNYSSTLSFSNNTEHATIINISCFPQASLEKDCCRGFLKRGLTASMQLMPLSYCWRPAVQRFTVRGGEHKQQDTCCRSNLVKFVEIEGRYHNVRYFSLYIQT